MSTQAYVPAGPGFQTFQTPTPVAAGAPPVLNGHGNPNGQVSGFPSQYYYDLDSTDAWLKLAGYGLTGWVRNGQQPVASGGGGSSSANVQGFSGTGSPMGVITPTAPFAFYTQTDSVPVGLIWSWYGGSWH